MMNAAIDYSGAVIRYLTVLRRAPSTKHCCVWECQCVCGKIVRVQSGRLRKAKSCGCKNANRRGWKKEHKRAYSIWTAMLARVRYSNRDSAKWYISKGITVCPQWLSFDVFLADMGDPPDGHLLDRIDGGQGYSKSNCRWATAKEQARNRSSTNWFLYRGARVTTTELAEVAGVPRTTIQAAIREGRVEVVVPGAVLAAKGTKAPRAGAA